jgi:hypothetical protein
MNKFQNSTEPYPVAWAELGSKPLLDIARPMFANGSNTSDGFRLHRLDGAATFGQWLVKSSVNSGNVNIP